MVSLDDRISNVASPGFNQGPPQGIEHNAWEASKGLVGNLEERLKAALDHSPGISQAGRYHLTSGGKRLRGRLALAGGLSLGLSVEAALPAAAAVELLHNASLVHDDLQDADVERRGHQTVWKRFGKDTALLLGDAMIAAAFAEAAQGPCQGTAEVTRAMSRCVAMLADGQRLDTSPPDIEHWTPAAYEEIARLKTGKLFALALELPLVLVGASSQQRQACSLALEWIGVGFQIGDDLCDISSSKGRPGASDLRMRRMSAVLVQHLRVASPIEARRLAWQVDAAPNNPEPEIERQIEALRTSGALPACLVQVRTALAKSESHMSGLPTGLADTLRCVGSEILDQAASQVPRELQGIDSWVAPKAEEAPHVRYR